MTYYYRFPTYFFGFDGYIYFTHTKQFTREDLEPIIARGNETKDFEGTLIAEGFVPIKWEGESA